MLWLIAIGTPISDDATCRKASTDPRAGSTPAEATMRQISHSDASRLLRLLQRLRSADRETDRQRCTLLRKLTRLWQPEANTAPSAQGSKARPSTAGSKPADGYIYKTGNAAGTSATSGDKSVTSSFPARSCPTAAPSGPSPTSPTLSTTTPTAGRPSKTPKA